MKIKLKRIVGGLFLLFLLQPLHLAAQELSFYRSASQSENLEDVLEKPFIDFEEKVNEGSLNGVYWIKIKNISEEKACEVTSSHIKEVVCFIDGFMFSPVSGSVFPTFILPANKVAFLKVTCEMEAFIPFRFTNHKEFNQQENKSLLTSGFYYGFTVMVLVMNLFYFFSLKEKSFLLYSVFLFFISVAMFQRDGFSHLLFGQNAYIYSYLEILTHFFVGLTGTIFAMDYLNMENYWKQYKTILFSLNAFVLISLVVYVMTDSFLVMKVSEFLVISILILIWFTAVFLFRKNTYSKIFVIAYFFILIMACDFFISPLIGWANLGITTKYMKIGGLLEMMLLSYAVVYRMRELHLDYKVMGRQLYDYTKQLTSLEDELQKLNEGKENDITADVLSSREIEILELIAAGKINKEIAEELFISVNTVKYHTKKLYAKLNIKSRSEIQPGFVESLN